MNLNVTITAIIATSIVVAACANQPAAPVQPAWSPMTPEQYAASLPHDVHPDSRSRVPLAKRDELNDEGKKEYDRRAAADTTSLAGLAGPGSLRLHGSGRGKAAEHVDKRLQELARLVVAREMDQAFEWTVHEPVALKYGLDPTIIDIIRHRKPLDSLPEGKERAIIQWGREVFQTHKVSPETFAALEKHLGRRTLIDLCDLMGSYATTAILLHTVNVQLPRETRPLLPVP